MKHPLLVLLLGGLLPRLAVAQQSASPAPAPAASSAPAAVSAPVPAKLVLYFNADGRRIATAEGADHREELMYHDSIGGIARIYYPSGKLNRVVGYLHFAGGIKHGGETSFYETGEVKSHADYKVGEQIGPYLQYYRAGQIRLRTYLPSPATDEKVRSDGFLPDGQPMSAEAAERLDRMPTYAGGGAEAIIAAIQRQVRYPTEALRRQIAGKVYARFMVDDRGFVRNIQIIKSPSPILNQTVLQAITSLGRFTPGISSSDAVDVFLTVPITFAIR
ncbi:MAG: TonB family protein [Janthinobacterium lividum]